MPLTSTAIERLKSGPERRELPDDRIKGLYLVVQPSGRKSWAVRTRIAGRPAKLAVGPYPAVGLKDARERATKLLGAIARGEDPRENKRQAKRQASDTVAAVVKQWLERDQQDNRSRGEVERALGRDVLPAWGRRSIHTITRRDVIDVLDTIAERGATTLARRVHAYLHRLFRWSASRGILAASPMDNVPKPGREQPRDRVLEDAELARLWRATERLGLPFGPLVRLLMLTGARREEIRALAWDEVKDNAIRLAGARTKTGVAHVIPLAPEAVALLDALPRIAAPGTDTARLCFTTNGETPVSGMSKAKARLDAIAASIGSDGGILAEPAPLAPWRLHDLRRTVATGLQRLGSRLEVIEAVLGHVGGSRAGIVGVYQRHSFEPEKRIALEAWARHVVGLTQPPAEKVTPLRRR